MGRAGNILGITLKKLKIGLLLSLLFSSCLWKNNQGVEFIIGTFTVFNRDSPYLIAAPHGDYDERTGEMVWDFCQEVAWDCLIVEGFRKPSAPINVNRPTEGVKKAETLFSKRAAVVYAKYLKKIRKLSRSLRLYVELHGNFNRETSHQIEIATAGISSERARRIKVIMEDELLAAGLRRYQIKIDVLDEILYKAPHTRNFGAMSLLNPALHIELPYEARTRYRKKSQKFLQRALSAIAATEFGEE